MKKCIAITTVLLICGLAWTNGRAQSQDKHEKPFQKVDQLEKVKLIEFLNLNDETNLKLIARRKEFKTRNRGYYKLLDSLVNELEQFENAGDKQTAAIKRCVDEYQKTEYLILKNRQEFIGSLYDILTPGQVAKYIIFEKKFKKEIQDFMFKHKGKNNGGE
jgi:hypothetical protein